MYVIETSLGRFEGETEKQAKALMRKAKKAHDEQQAIDSANYQLAYVRAQAQAYAIMSRKVKGEGMPQGWRLLPITASSYCVREVYEDYQAQWVVDVGNAQAQSGFHGARPYEYIENGAGFCIALVFRNPKTEERIVHAVGVEGNQLAVVEVYGVQAEDFRLARELVA